MRSKFTSTGLIPVSEILLDQNNYRLGPLDSQMDCVTIMFEEFGAKITKIAGHILQNGLSPKPVVVSKDDQGRWVVRDGNRRITALKLLNNPAEAPDQYQRTFQTLIKNVGTGVIPNAIDCLTADESTIIEYRKLEHMGEQEGIGQVDWSPRAKENMQADVDGKLGYPLATAVCGYLGKKGVAEARKVSLTNIQRLLQDVAVSKRLGLAWDGQQFILTAKEDEVFNVLKEIILDFTIGKKVVGNIYHPPDRQTYIDTLFKSRGLKKLTPLDKPLLLASGKQVPKGSADVIKTRTITKPAWDRNRVIQRGVGLPVPNTEPKLQTIIAELSSKIDVRQATIAAGVLIRLVLERSVESYVKKNKISFHENDKLHVLIDKAAQKMKEVGTINKNQLRQLQKMRNVEHLISAHTLHAWVHNPDYTPTPREVCTFWDNIYFFLVACWK